MSCFSSGARMSDVMICNAAECPWLCRSDISGSYVDCLVMFAFSRLVLVVYVSSNIISLCCVVEGTGSVRQCSLYITMSGICGKFVVAFSGMREG